MTPFAERLRQWLRDLVLLLVCALLVLLIYGAAELWPRVRRSADDVRATAWNLRTATWETSRIAGKLHEDYTAEDGYATAVWANLETSAVISRQTVEALSDTRALIADSRRALFGDHGLFVEASGLIADLSGAVAQAQDAIDDLADDAHAVLAPLARAVGNVEKATAEAESALQKGGPELERAATNLADALKHLDQVASDPNVQATIAHVERGTGSIALALEPLRKTGGRLVKLLKFAAGRIHVNLW